jgi:hypothetical protein
MKDVDYTPELAVIPFGEHRSKAIKKLIEVNNATHDAQRTSSLDFEAAPGEEPNAIEEHDVITIDDSQHQRLRQEGIIIGVAKPHFCRVSHERPVVRAMLNTRNAVIAFIPGKYAKVLNRELTGEVQIPMKDVDYGRELADLSFSEIVGMVRERLVKKGEKMRMKRDCLCRRVMGWIWLLHWLGRKTRMRVGVRAFDQRFIWGKVWSWRTLQGLGVETERS